MSSVTFRGESEVFGLNPLLDDSTLPNGLASHQISALQELEDRRVYLIADPTGAGKTAVAAACIAGAFWSEGARRAIWITEAILVDQTLRELHRFLPLLQISTWPGRAGDHIRVMSIEAATRRLREVKRFRPDVVVLDEATSVKGEGVESDAVAEIMLCASRRLALTATPVELNALEAYRILEVMGATRLPKRSFFELLLEWQELPYGRRRPLATIEEEIGWVRTTLARHTLSRSEDEVGLTLPELTEQTIWVELTPPQQRAYQQAGDADSPLAVHARQEKAGCFADGRSAIAEAAVDWLEVHPEVHKALAFAHNLEHLSILEGLLKRAGIGYRRIDGPTPRGHRAKAIADFRDDPTVRLLIGTRVLERGIDGLQFCRVLITLGPSYNPARERQRIGRLRRPGSPYQDVFHLTFAPETDLEREKEAKLNQRRREARRLLTNLPVTAVPKEDAMLSKNLIASLEESRPWLEPCLSTHGTALAQVVSSAPPGQFLDNAIRTGHLPDFDSIGLLIEAYSRYVEEEIRQALAQGKRGEACAWSAMIGEFKQLTEQAVIAAARLQELGAQTEQAV